MISSENFVIFLAAVVTGLSSPNLLAHGNKKHAAHSADHNGLMKNTTMTAVESEINMAYQKTVGPIFDRKCADCHSSKVAAPWYGSVPGIGKIVSKDRSEAQTHLEIANGYPFQGHGDPESDLEAIAETVKNDSMPTRLYRLVHWSSSLTADEKQTILNWVQQSQKRIQSLREDNK